MTPEDPKDIIMLVKNGDHKAFKTLVTMYRQAAFSLSFRILCNEEDARDIVQESFIRVWENIGSYDPGKRFTTWLFRIVTNCSIDRLRSSRRHTIISMDRVPELLSRPSDPNGETILGNKQIGGMIRLIADGLPEKQRLVFILRDIEGMDSSETEQVLGMTADLVKSNLWHARKAVREKLSGVLSYERI